MRRLLFFLTLCLPVSAQIGSKGVLFVTTDPSGSCANGSPLRYNFNNGALWGCDSGTWTAITGGGGGGSGTVTSVGLALPNIFTISGSPVTTSGTLTGTFATETANTVLSGPTTGAAAAPTFRALVTADMPAGTAQTGSPLSQFAATSSAQLLGVLSDETGTGLAVFSISPALTGSPTAPTASQNDNSTKLATTAYTDLAISNAVAGVNPAVAVLAASTAALTGTYSNGVAGIGATFTITATGAFTLDGIAINTIGQRVLFKDQASGFQNGVYTATVVGTTGVSPIFTRALDYDAPSDINSTGAIPVQSGTVNTTTSWLLTSTVTTVGTDALTYVKFSIAPTSIVTAASPGAGIARFAGGTQAVTSAEISGDGTTSGSNVLTIANNAITNAKSAQMATMTLKGNNTGSTANAIDLTGAQANSILGQPTIAGDTLMLYDEFAGGNSSSGTFSQIGWVLGTIGGAPTGSFKAGVWPNLGIGSLLTTNTSGQGGTFNLAASSVGPLGDLTTNTNWDSMWIFRINQTTTTRFRIGFGIGSAINVAQPTDGFWLRYDTNAAFVDTTYFLCARTSSGTEACFNTTIAADTNFHKVRIRSTVAGTILMTLDAGAEKSFCPSSCDVTVTGSTVAMTPFMDIVTDTTATKSADADMFIFKIRSLTR